MNFYNLLTFLTIVETRSISKTAEKLFLSQSTVSHRLKTLEKDLDAVLLIRNRGERTIDLTLKGEEFVMLAKKWLALSKETNRWKTKDPKLSLKIGSVDSLNNCLFLPFYKELIKKDSPMTIHVSTHWSLPICERVDRYDLDIGFALWPINLKNLLIKPLFSEKFVVISTPEAELPDEVHPRDLDPEDEIFFYVNQFYQSWHDYWWIPENNKQSKVDTASLLISLFEDQKKWAIISKTMAVSLSKKRELKISELKDPPQPRICYQIENRYKTPNNINALKIFHTRLDEFLKSNENITIIKDLK